MSIASAESFRVDEMRVEHVSSTCTVAKQHACLPAMRKSPVLPLESSVGD